MSFFFRISRESRNWKCERWKIQRNLCQIWKFLERPLLLAKWVNWLHDTMGPVTRYRGFSLDDFEKNGEIGRADVLWRCLESFWDSELDEFRHLKGSNSLFYQNFVKNMTGLKLFSDVSNLRSSRIRADFPLRCSVKAGDLERHHPNVNFHQSSTNRFL